MSCEDKRFGTCAFCIQQQRIEYFDVLSPQPHHRPVAEDWPMNFRCFALSAFEGEHPPAVERGIYWGFEIQPGDCGSCRFYQPAGLQPMRALLRKSRARWRRKREKMRKAAA